MKFLKKLFAFSRWLLIGALWSYVYLLSTLLLFKSVWGFNYLSQSSWNLISKFWSAGGKIYSTSDYLFVLCLILLIPVWIWGWKKLYKTSFIGILLSPILWYQKREANNTLKKMSRNKILNIGVSVGDDIKKDFENKLKKQQSDVEKSQNASKSIRNNLKNKLSQGNK
jgi:hypothetical protein